MADDRVLEFPEGFVWGAAGCAHQTEGGNSGTDWWEHELLDDSPAVEPSGQACDSWNRYAEDWRLAADAGLDAVRLSIEWARIEPRPGEVDHAAVDHYRSVIGTAQDLGLLTNVTLQHFTLPLWFTERGSWLGPDAVSDFARYVRVVTAHLGDLLQQVGTINEPQVLVNLGYVTGVFPPRRRDREAAAAVAERLMACHLAAVQELRSGTEAEVGALYALPAYVGDGAEEQLAEVEQRWIEPLAVAGDPGDWVGLQYYTKETRAPDGTATPVVDEGDQVTQMGWAWYPDGLTQSLAQIAGCGLPIVVTENGIATADDAERIRFVTQHLVRLHAAVEAGRDVRGYHYWSLLDNFEWNEGYRPTFGLVAVDRTTFERHPKPSLAWLGEVARRNAVRVADAG